jgi:hypothetical protein
VNPDEALERAQRASFGEDLSGFVVEPTNELTLERMMEWAVIETDPDLIRSTRPGGAPITWFKRFLRRMLAQELGQAYAQQSRFNLMVLSRLQELESLREAPPGP